MDQNYICLLEIEQTVQIGIKELYVEDEKVSTNWNIELDTRTTSCFSIPLNTIEFKDIQKISVVFCIRDIHRGTEVVTPTINITFE